MIVFFEYVARLARLKSRVFLCLKFVKVEFLTEKLALFKNKLNFLFFMGVIKVYEMLAFCYNH